MAAANRQRGEVSLDLAGTAYTLKLTTNAICLMEQAFQPLRPFAMIVANASRGSFSDLRAFLWASLQAHHPDLTIVKVGDLMDQAGGIDGLALKLAELAEANQEGGDGKGPPQTGQGSGTGGGST